MPSKKQYQGMTADFFREYFQYQDGRLIRLKTVNGLYPAGTEVGRPKKTGYWAFSFMHKDCLIHRVVFFMHHGFLPKYIDHIDSDRSNNRIENLRPATASQNIIHSHRTSKSGYRGVRQQTQNSWCAVLCKNRLAIFQENFKTAIEAARAYDRAAIRYHKKFAILNFPRGDYE